MFNDDGSKSVSPTQTLLISSLTVDVLAYHRSHDAFVRQADQRHVSERRHGVVPTLFVVRQRLALLLPGPDSVFSPEVRYAYRMVNR